MGTWISAYGPIKNSQGENVGAVGIDFAADYVSQVQSAIRSRIVLAFLFTYGSLIVLVFLLARFLTRPIVKLTRMAKCVAEGDYDQDFSNDGAEIWCAYAMRSATWPQRSHLWWTRFAFVSSA